MKRYGWLALFIIALLLFPMAVESNYYRHIFIMSLMWVVIGCA